MAKLKAPLLSLGASGAIGKTLVFFNWKGLDVVREYVVPANPKTDPQKLQRKYMTEAVALIHAAQVLDPNPLDEVDASAYALWGSTFPTPRTWFNQFVRVYLKQKVAGKHAPIFRNMTITAPATGKLLAICWTSEEPDLAISAGTCYYGVSKTALINSVALTPEAGAHNLQADIPNLTNGTKYFLKFVPTAPDSYDGAQSGIYHGTPSA